MTPLSEARSQTPLSEPPVLTFAELERDPHGTFRRHRLVTPLIRREDGVHFAIRAGDVERLATDPRTRQLETEIARMRNVSAGALFDITANSMLYTNGPDHHRRRSAMSRAFALRLITDLRPRVRAVANSLIDRCYARGEMNLLDEYAALIPAQMISEILGLAEPDIPRFTRWVYEVSRWFSGNLTADDIPVVEEAARHLTDYVRELLADRRAKPREDFLTAYAAAAVEAGNLSPIETLVQIVSVIIGGSDTTRAAMTIQVATLLEHREQWEALRADAALVPAAVSEALRYEPPVGSIPRFTLEDIEMQGYLCPRNSVLMLSTLSALRDPALYNEPDRFNIRRTDQPRRHLVFGAGSHRCLGEALARAELEEGLAVLVERLPRLELTGLTPLMVGHSGIRRVGGMRVGWKPQ